ncbi:hypothetical protein AB0B63_27365 [Micromonospora sp. NPDC049081]|uniref:hypothetical protein n=1 Tax=Micromonospora sp. NPDC049081 TaxID=3155150 RepID=UPI003402CC9E
MQERAWFKDRQLVPGETLFSSTRSFALWAYTVSHSQLLFRTRTGGNLPRLDLLFKPVKAIKVRDDYDGLVIRVATVEEEKRILSETGSMGSGRVLMLLTGASMDYVVTGSFGWQEDHGSDRDPSGLAFFPPGSDPARILPPESA